jgi:hypothetical protein
MASNPPQPACLLLSVVIRIVSIGGAPLQLQRVSRRTHWQRITNAHWGLRGYRITNQVVSPKAAITEKITSNIVTMLRFSVGA